MAMLNENTEICELLLGECGLAADMDVVSKALIVLGLNAPRVGDYREMFRLFIEVYAVDVELGTPPSKVSDLPRWWLHCPEKAVLDMVLRNQATLDPSQPVLPLSQLDAIDLDPYGYGDFRAPEVLLRVFGIVWTPVALASLPMNIKNRLLHFAAVRWDWYKNLGHCQAPGSDYFSTTLHWLQLGLDMVRAGADPAFVLEGKTALMRFLTIGRKCQRTRAFGPENLEWLLEALQRWISGLAGVGANILQYGESEQQAWTSLGFIQE